MAGYRELSDRLAAWTGTMGAFSRALDREGTPYLSFSKVVSVEFCSCRYLLEYVQRKRLRPPPDYFVNGQAFHETAARMYRGLSRGKRPDEAGDQSAGVDIQPSNGPASTATQDSLTQPHPP